MGLEGREYLCAGRFTIADIAVAFSVHFALVSVGLDKVLRPSTAHWWERVTARDAYGRWRRILACDLGAICVVGPVRGLDTQRCPTYVNAHNVYYVKCYIGIESGFANTGPVY